MRLWVTRAFRDGAGAPRRRRSLRRRGLMFALALAGAEASLLAQRRGSLLALDTVVRCRGGHLFTTWWIPGVSIKALRLGPWRLQRCPVGGHWSLVSPVRIDDLTEEERSEAAMHHDRRVP